METFRTKLARACGRGPGGTSWAWLGNFEVERDWKRADVLGLPGLPGRASEALNNSLSELALLLAAPEDLVLLKQVPDPDFLAYLAELGWKTPSFVVAGGEEELSLTRSLLENASALEKIRTWTKAASGRLMPHGVSPLEEELARKSGLPLAAPLSAVARRVNSKVYSRRLCARLGIRQTEGRIALSVDELERVLCELEPLLLRTPLVLKDAMGVSGKGILLLDSEARCRQALRMLRQAADKRGHARAEFIVEQWISKNADVNYQFMVGKNGQTEMLGVLTALVRGGVHQGHLHPHTLPPEAERELADTAATIGRELAYDGYYGVVGVDAMVGADGTLYPCVEINARLNMSTYHTRVLSEHVPEGRYALIRAVPFTSVAPFPFAVLRDALGEALYTKRSGRGIFVCAFAPAGMSGEEGGPGRLYAAMIGDSRDECLNWYEQCCKRLQTIAGVQLSGQSLH